VQQTKSAQAVAIIGYLDPVNLESLIAELVVAQDHSESAGGERSPLACGSS
jgi:hypothetical protein